ncbi:hypothetical protein BDZ91DRAFT_747457 [Kalaharituber pfeilii]|nr:hypothetical protein BDZ91DRAFT_747457 [Kalaharituber pfeilii]
MKIAGINMATVPSSLYRQLTEDPSAQYRTVSCLDRTYTSFLTTMRFRITWMCVASYMCINETTAVIVFSTITMSSASARVKMAGIWISSYYHR